MPTNIRKQLGTTRAGPPASPQGRRNPALTRTLLIGAAAQALLIGLPLLDGGALGTVRRHVETAYPLWGAANVSADTTAIVIGMVAIGVLGLGGWLATLLVTRRGRWVRTMVTSMFAGGVLALASVVGLSGGHYHPIVPPWLGATSLAVAVATGVAALVAAWRRPR